ncbi:MAG: TetR family transcriptional regulator [Microbacterium sp.]|uniref:TetR/AcrR family transcriptional regulator n=1 Tax=Microbacterium sp. TaxID=51671 RepID=UPI002613D4E8|nr:TetR family transcriptional regulator [Microbacterium sp.]MCX6501374.1 TetR family transcriptional regulator [Microbacterium sp.]
MTADQDPSARRRLPRAELRRRILDAGEDLLASGGLAVGLQHLNMEELIRRVGVPRSSVFAAFGGKEELVTELMVQALRAPDPAAVVGYSPPTVEVAKSILVENADRLMDAAGRPDAAGQDAVLREVIRRVILVNVEDMTVSTEWQTYMALSVSVRSLPPGRRERVHNALHAAEARFITEMADVYGHAFEALGRRPRTGFTLRHVATAGASVVEGIVSRRLVGSADADATITRPGLDGGPVEWHLAAVAFLAMILEMTERTD